LLYKTKTSYILKRREYATRYLRGPGRRSSAGSSPLIRGRRTGIRSPIDNQSRCTASTRRHHACAIRVRSALGSPAGAGVCPHARTLLLVSLGSDPYCISLVAYCTTLAGPRPRAGRLRRATAQPAAAHGPSPAARLCTSSVHCMIHSGHVSSNAVVASFPFVTGTSKSFLLEESDDPTHRPSVKAKLPGAQWRHSTTRTK
jgi:hypothetical protein